MQRSAQSRAVCVPTRAVLNRMMAGAHSGFCSDFGYAARVVGSDTIHSCEMFHSPTCQIDLLLARTRPENEPTSQQFELFLSERPSNSLGCTHRFSQRTPAYGGTGEQAKGPVAHFSYLGRNVEEMMVTGTPAWPAERCVPMTLRDLRLRTRGLGESFYGLYSLCCATWSTRVRTLLSSGILEAALLSRTQGVWRFYTASAPLQPIGDPRINCVSDRDFSRTPGGHRMSTPWLDVRYCREDMPPYHPI
jgi:hypothetical protein